jgi:tRNA (cytidine/uridine-2'-O-)-methyltransferase
MLNVVLVQPEIPPNTGNVIRLCANTGASLHLVEPLGFPLDSARMRRAGLDYHEFAALRVHRNWQALRELAAAEAAARPGGAPRMFALTTRGAGSPFDQRFERGDWLVFGCETRGLPPDVLADFGPERRLRLPMRPHNRSLNLSNAVAVTVFEAWRQFGFEGAANSASSN